MTDDATLVESLPPPRLVVRVGGRATQEITLQIDAGPEVVSIGRAEDNAVRLTDPKVSRHHARVVKEGAAFVLTDLGSANGTLVNGTRLTAPHSLQHGEQIIIGDAELTYEDPGAEARVTAVGPGHEATVAVVVPPPPAPSSSLLATGNRRSLVIGLIAVPVALLLLLAVVALFRAAPDLLERMGQVSPVTQTPEAEAVSPTAPAQTPQVAGTPRGLQTALESPLATTALLSSAVTPVTADGTETPIDGLLIQADALTQRSKFEEAAAVYQELVRQTPNDALPEVGWAWALILDDEADEALVHARRAVELDANSADAATALARAYAETGNEVSALATAQKAVLLDPGSAEAHAVLAEATMINGQDSAALAVAVDEANLALSLDANSANAHRIRGWLYQVADKDMARAVGELQSAAGLQPELWLRRHELGLLLLRAEGYGAPNLGIAILAFQEALGLRPKAVTYTAMGEAHYRLGQYDQAKAALEHALTAGEEDADGSLAGTYALMAATNAYLGRCDEAEIYYEQALVLDPTNPHALEARDVCEGAKPRPSPSPTTAGSTLPPPITTAQPTTKATKSPPPAALSGRIAFPMWNREGARYDTYVAQADGSDRHLVVEDMHQPAFSPDGKWLAVNGARPDHMNLLIVRPDGSELKRITDFMEDKLPSWSPDSKGVLLATTRDQPGRPKRIYVIDDVLTIGRPQKGRLLASGDKPVQGEYPTWMPNGRIVYQGCDYTVTPQQCGLFTIYAIGGAFQQLTRDGRDTAPAAYGGRIAFMSSRDGNWEVYVMSDDGSGVKRLTNSAAHDGLPTWSPDGKTIAFVSNQGGTWAVWAMSPNGTNRRKLFDIGDGGLAFEWQNERISWGP